MFREGQRVPDFARISSTCSACMTNTPSKFLGYATLSLQFLRTAENCCSELAARDNMLTMIVDASVPFDLEAFEEATGWSDHKIAIPILFNFFHGIELTLKGFLAQAGSAKKTHKLTQLFAEFKRIYGDCELATLLDRCVNGIDPKLPLGTFLERNEVSIDDWYQTLKYPETTGGIVVAHTALQYKGSDGVPFWQGIESQARDIRLSCIALARERGIAR